MTTTIERPSPAQESSKMNLEFIPDEQLRQTITNKIDTLDSLYRSYLLDPSQIPEKWNENLEGLDPKDHAEVLAELCITSDASYYPGFTEDENPPPETIKLYNQIRETAFERLTSEEKTNSVTETSSDPEIDTILERRTNYRIKRSLINAREARATSVEKEISLANKIPSVVGNNTAKTLELNGADEIKLEKVLNDYAEMYAAKLAKESDRSLGQLFHERSDSHIREELTDMMGLLATHLMDKAEAAGIPKEEYPALIEDKLSEVTDKVVEKMADARMKEYDDSSAVRKYVYSKWSSWNEQGRAGKVKQAVVMGAISAPIAIAAAPIAGVAVGAGLAGAMIATASRSLGRGLISAHINQKANAPDNIQKADTNIRSKVQNFNQQSEDKNRNSFEVLSIIDSSVDKYRKRNRRRVLGGVGIAMSVGLVSATLAEYISDSAFGASPANASEITGTDRHPLNDANNEYSNVSVADVRDDSRVDMGIPKEIDGLGEGTRYDYENGTNTTDGNEAQTPEQTSGKLGREGMFDGQYGTRHLSPEGKKFALQAVDGYRVKSGDSLWSLSEQLCRDQGISNPTVYEIDATKDLLLEQLDHSGAVDKTGNLVAGSRLVTH